MPEQIEIWFLNPPHYISKFNLLNYNESLRFVYANFTQIYIFFAFLYYKKNNKK
jgi:hypothetical protein